HLRETFSRTHLRAIFSINRSSNHVVTDKAARKFNNVASVVNVIVSFYITYDFLRLIRTEWWRGITLFTGVVISVGPLITFVILCVGIVLGYLFDKVVIELIASALERPNLDKWVKAIATVLLLVGFHFDLLAA